MYIMLYRRRLEPVRKLFAEVLNQMRSRVIFWQLFRYFIESMILQPWSKHDVLITWKPVVENRGGWWESLTPVFVQGWHFWHLLSRCHVHSVARFTKRVVSRDYVQRFSMTLWLQSACIQIITQSALELSLTSRHILQEKESSLA